MGFKPKEIYVVFSIESDHYTYCRKTIESIFYNKKLAETFVKQNYSGDIKIEVFEIKDADLLKKDINPKRR